MLLTQAMLFPFLGADTAKAWGRFPSSVVSGGILSSPIDTRKGSRFPGNAGGRRHAWSREKELVFLPPSFPKRKYGLPDSSTCGGGLLWRSFWRNWKSVTKTRIFSGSGWSWVAPLPSGVCCFGEHQTGVSSSLLFYFLELNPVEHFWEWLREKFFHKILFDDLKAVEDCLKKALLSFEQNARKASRLTGWDWMTNIKLSAN